MSVLVTGASGFVGTAVCRTLMASGFQVRVACRESPPPSSAPEVIRVGDIDGRTEWTRALTGIHSIIHLAARVHVMNETTSDPLAQFRRVNVAGTAHLAREAAKMGVRRFIYVSSAKVFGERNSTDSPFVESDPPKPGDPYALSKWEAEQALWRLAAETGFEVVVLRPPLVYGPGVKGNFLQLLKLVARGVPLPLGSIANRRSLVFVDNLASAIRACLDHPRAPNETFLVSDDEDLSTPEIVRRLARGMSRTPRILSVPVSALRLGGMLIGKSAAVSRLTESLAIDSSHIRDILKWTSPYSIDEGCAATTAWFTKEFPALT